jgi:hypothetical protein
MVAHQAPMAVAEYLAMETAGDVKHEYVDGVAHAMAGSTITLESIGLTIPVAQCYAGTRVLG